ncbi:TonB-dependent receptor [Parabacteroides sp.]
MKPLSRILMLLFISVTAGHAQQATLSGLLYNEKNEVLPDANVFFLQKDSLMAGVITDPKGEFSIKMDTGRYTLYISFLGFEEYSREIVLTPGGLKLPPVILRSKAIALDETVVAADRNPYEVKQNREIYNVPLSIKKSMQDIYQVLTHVPSLKVDLNERKIEIAGVSNKLIMVNNVRREDGYLLTIDPEEVERVEVIRNTGVQYSSENIDGILNVITKPRRSGTQRGNFGVQLHPGMAYGFLNSYYFFALDKFSFTFMGSYFFFNEKKRDITISRTSHFGGDIVHMEKRTDSTRFKMHNPYVMASMNYIISEKTFASLDFLYNGSPQTMERPYQGSVFVNDQKSYDFRSNTLDDSKFNSYDLSYYLQTQFDENRTADLQVAYSNTQDKQINLFEEWRKDNGAYTNLWTDNKNQQHEIDAQTNYKHKLGKHLLEIGYRFFRQYNRFDGRTDAGLDHLKYDEWRNYLYAGLSGDLTDKWSYQLGVGYDWVKTEVNKGMRNRFHEFTPNARVSYAITGKQNISLDYRRNRQSPSFSNLNPIRTYSDTSYVYYGNPYLRPYYANTLRLNYQFGVNCFYLMTSLQYQYVNNFIVTREFLDDSGVYNITVDNAGRYSSVSANLNLSVNVLKWWKISMNGTMARRSYKDDHVDQFNKDFWVPRLWVSSMVNYDKLSVNFDYSPILRTRTLTGYLEAGGESSLNASYNLTSNIGVSLGCRYLFPMTYKREVYESDFEEITRDKMVERSWRVLLGFRYYFQKGKQRGSKQNGAKQYNDDVKVGIEKY